MGDGKLKNDLKVAIIRAGKTNIVVAQECGISPNYVSQIIKGKKIPSIELALKLLKAVNKKPEQIGEVFWIEEGPGD